MSKKWVQAEKQQRKKESCGKDHNCVTEAGKRTGKIKVIINVSVNSSRL